MLTAHIKTKFILLFLKYMAVSKAEYVYIKSHGLQMITSTPKFKNKI